MPRKIRRFMGNPKLRRIGEQIEWTPETIAEYHKCSKDFIYFIENHMKVVTPNEEGLVNIKLYNYQKKALRGMHNNRNSAFNFSRQSGKSIMVSGYLLWFVIFHETKVVAILANKGDTAIKILGNIEKAYQELPEYLKHGIKEFNKKTLELENGSKIIASATTGDNVRGETLAIAYLDECAFIEDYETFFASVYPTISAGKKTKIIMTSTPKGMNHFYKIIEDGKRKKTDPNYNGYFVMEVPWYMVPGRNEAWRKETLKGLSNDKEKFDQEFNIQFLGSSGTLIPGWKLKQLVAYEPKITGLGVKQWVIPNKGQIYAMVVDVARGVGADYSAFQIIDVTKMPYVQVAAFRDKTITPSDFAHLINIISKMYFDPMILIEVNDLGQEVSDLLHEVYEMDNLLYTDNAGSKGRKLSNGFGKSGNSKIRRGIPTTKIVKTGACYLFRLLVENNQLIIQDEDTIDELKTFVKKGTGYEAEPGHHDDLTMCMVLFSWMSSDPYFKDLTNIGTVEQIKRVKEEELIEALLPMPIFDDGMDAVDIQRKKEIDWLFAEELTPEPEYETSFFLV